MNEKNVMDKYKEEKSDAWYMIELLGKQNKRMFISSVLVILLWFGTTLGFVGYLYQYDFDAYYIESTEGHANYIGNDGDIYNGESNSNKESPEEGKA